MKLLSDTHSLFWLFSNNKKLSLSARNLLENSEKIFIPTIVILELLYLLNKIGLQSLFPNIFTQLKNNSRYSIIPLDLEITETLLTFPDTMEMHDRIIIATAKLMKVPVVTKDQTIKKIFKHTIW